MVDLLKETGKGEKAKAILENEAFKDDMNMINATYFDAWSNSLHNDRETREHCYNMFQAVKDLEGNLNSVLKTGEFASKQINN